MNAAIIWKEYRQLRGVWVVVTLLTILVLEGLLATVGSTTSWLDHINTIRIVLFSIVVSGIAAHGIVAGAMLIARDKEEGTEAFFDSLTCRRSGVWWNKLAIGIFMVILQGLAMVALLVSHGATSLEESSLLPLLGVATLAWGVLGGALCRHVLSATLLACMLMAGSWLVAFPIGVVPGLFLTVEGLFSLGALLAAQIIYCRQDQDRLPVGLRYPALRFLARNQAIVLGTFTAIVFLVVTYKLIVTYHIGKYLLLAAELGVSVAIVLILRSRLPGWVLIFLAAGLSALIFVTGFLMVFHSVAGIPEIFLFVEFVACSGAALLSRIPPSKTIEAPKWRDAWPAFVGSWKSTLWLVCRQGKWIFLAAALLALVAGTAARFAPMLVWPIGSMLVGILCGLGVFCPDQKEGRAFWAGQRFPSGRIWFIKIITWTVLLASVLIFSGMGNIWWSLRTNTVDFRPFSWLERWEGIEGRNHSFASERQLDISLFALMWPIYGFTIALLFGQLAPRTIIAATLAIVVVPIPLALWVPSFLIGGLPVWQVMIIPGLLLLASVAIQHAWIAGRLASLKSIGILATCLMASLVWLAGSLWHRAAEVPDVGEPFDRSTFLAELPPPSDTGPELLTAIQEFYRDTAQIEKAFAPERSANVVSIGAAEPRADLPNWIHIDRFDQKLWLKQSKRLAPELDKLFKSARFARIQSLAASPLGLIQDVRKDRSPNRISLGDTEVDRLARLMDWRIGQLVENRDYTGALQILETGFDVARQLENFAPINSFINGTHLETILLGSGLDRWLQAVRTNRGQILAIQHLVQRQEATRPDPAGAIKTQFIINRSMEPFELGSPSPLDLTYRRLAVQIPWEKIRQQRVLRASVYGALSALRRPRIARAKPEYFPPVGALTLIAEQAELPPTYGIGSELPAPDWGAFVLQSYPSGLYEYSNLIGHVFAQVRAFKAVRIAIAIRLYQIDHSRPPDQLDDLVPNYLPSLPTDPQGMPVGVEWEESEEIAGPSLAARLMSQASVLHQAQWGLAIALADLSHSMPSPSSESRSVDIPEPLGAGSSGMDTRGMQSPGSAGSELGTLVPIFPRPVVSVGHFVFGKRN